MKFNSKQEVCNWVNQKIAEKRVPRMSLRDSFRKLDFTDWFVEELLRPREVKVPIYTSKWKIKAIKKLQARFHSQEELEHPNWTSSRDYSRVIWADAWKTYPFEDTMAIPKYTTKHSTFWEIALVHEFCKEDLQFGVRPIFIYRRMMNLGRGPLLVDDSNGDIYSSDSFQVEDAIKDFENYLVDPNSSNRHWELNDYWS